MEIPGEYGINFDLSGDLQQSVCTLLQSHGYERVYNHSCRVAEEAAFLARQFGADTEKANAAALLHDIGVIIPDARRIGFLNSFGMEALPEEAVFPMILHQRISGVIARHLFHMDDSDILNAIECHTTLKAKASKLDMVLFVSDKLRWDQSGDPPWHARIVSALADSLEKGSLSYIEYLLENKSSLKVIHPWLLAAYNDLLAQ